jgi:hypothetical protein
MNWKGCGMNWSGPKFRVFSWYLPGGIEVNYEETQIGWYPI